jgi:hypothetical protein
MAINRRQVAALAIKAGEQGHIQGALESFVHILRLGGVLQEQDVERALLLISAVPDCTGEHKSVRTLLAEIANCT